MINVTNISKIGFGTYRVSINSSENQLAIRYAIENGCNLLDTASNYENGNSERLVGSILKELSADVFVVTKAGYISEDNLTNLFTKYPGGKGLCDMVNISDSFKHCIHPDYLNWQLNISLQRLNRKWIDGFLLHSPEYYFTQKETVSKEEYYRRIESAFSFLEEKVQEGIIRYYGVSSNTLQIPGNENSTDLLELLLRAEKVSTFNHFKIIQFPFNIVESDALLHRYEEKSLIDLAKERDILTFSNRPLNTNTKSGAFRLVIYDEEKLNLNEAEDLITHNRCFSIIEEQLKLIKPGSKLSDFAIIDYLNNNWTSIPSEEAFLKLFNNNLYQFIKTIFQNDIPTYANSAFTAFKNVALKYHLKTVSERTRQYLNSNNLSNLLPEYSSRPLAANLCSAYLEKGINHVLIGMRRKEYIDEVKSMF